MADSSITPLQLTIHPQPQAPAFFSGANGLPSFQDVLDTLNPLQHIPIVSNIYQALTGDVASPAANIIGGGLFGGPLGLAGSIFNTIIQQNTGSDVAGNVLAGLEGRPIPALQPQKGDTPAMDLADAMPPDHLSANQRAAFNAYVNASMLT